MSALQKRPNNTIYDLSLHSFCTHLPCKWLPLRSKNQDGGLIDLHLEDMKSASKQIGRSKAFSMAQLKKALGKIRFEHLDRERIIQFGKARAEEGAGPAVARIICFAIASAMRQKEICRVTWADLSPRMRTLIVRDLGLNT